VADRESDDPRAPRAPGWYPDPWSATGEGERYFDGQKWGSTERPLGGHTVLVEEHEERPAKHEPGRPRRPVIAIAVFAALVLAVWGIPKLFHSGGSTTSHKGSAASAPSISNDSRPPASQEEAAEPLGKPATPPAGSGGYSVLMHQPNDAAQPVAWDPCRPIHYVVDSSGAPADGSQLLEQAVARVGQATGLRFVADGATTEQPAQGRAAYQPDRYTNRWAPVLIAWSNAAAFPALGGTATGATSAAPVTARNRRLVYVSGQVVLDSADLSAASQPDRAAARAVVLHELGHLVGLGDTPDRTQLMSSDPAPGIHDYRAGDLRGLALLGSQACAPGL
jgi:hypothetical protein